jgi:hypothetical protein
MDPFTAHIFSTIPTRLLEIAKDGHAQQNKDRDQAPDPVPGDGLVMSTLNTP